MPGALKMTLRPSEERGSADHGWLKSFHTFSFASYASMDHEGFGNFRVLNEDRVAAGTGFGTHPHSEFEIFSYLVSGELEHKDSMGNSEVLKRGGVQMTSAGTGIRHSEKCHGSKQVHFLQMWAVPYTRRLTPKYYTRYFTDEQKKDQWAHIVAPATTKDISDERDAESGPAPIHSPLSAYATLISPEAKLDHTAERARVYIHLIQTSGYNTGPAQGGHIRVSADGSSVELKEGDGVYVSGTTGKNVVVENVGDKVGEVIMFDVE